MNSKQDEGESSPSASGDGGNGSKESTAMIPPCEKCGEPAPKTSPFSARRLCFNHVMEEVTIAQSMNRSPTDLVQPYVESAMAMRVLLKQEQERLIKQEASINEIFDSMQRSLSRWNARSTERLLERKDTAVALEELERTVAKKTADLKAASAAGNVLEAQKLKSELGALRIQLRKKMELAERQRVSPVCGDEAVREQLEQLNRVNSMLHRQLTGPIGSAPWLPQQLASPLKRSHTIDFDDRVEWVAACSDSSGFCANPDGRVVPIGELPSAATSEAASSGAAVEDLSTEAFRPLPQPCLVLKIRGRDHLSVVSPDGKVQLRSYCEANQWTEPICGIHCDRQLVFVGQKSGVTVTDLAGRLIRLVSSSGLIPRVAQFPIRGIGGNSQGSLFLCNNNWIVVCSKATGALTAIIALFDVPDAELRSVAFHQDCILVTDMKNGRVYRVDSRKPHKLLLRHPTRDTALARFQRPLDVAVDSRGRLYVSESGRDAVSAMLAGDNGVSAGTVGPDEPAADRVGFPCGLDVVPACKQFDDCELLAVTDLRNKRLVMYKIVS